MLELHGKNMGGLALNIEWSKRSPRFNLKESRVANKVNKDKCYNCGKPGHISRECKEGPECYECGSLGHIARDCPKSREVTRKRSPRRSPRKSSSERSYSIERSSMPIEFFPLDMLKIEDTQDDSSPDLETEDGSKFTLVNGGTSDENSIYKCSLCEKLMQKNSIKRHVATKTHKDKLPKP